MVHQRKLEAADTELCASNFGDNSGTSILQNPSYTYSNNDQTVALSSTEPLDYLSKYAFSISKNLESIDGASFNGFSNN